MKTFVVLTASLTILATLVLGPAVADRNVCENVTLAACAGHGEVAGKGAYCAYAWTGITGPAVGLFACGGDNDCEIYFDTFAAGAKDCEHGAPFDTVGEDLWTEGNLVYTTLP